MSKENPYSILVLAGSYRSGSFNQALVAGVREVADPNVSLVEFDLRRLPHYDGDLEAAGDPETVVELKAMVRSSDALLIVTPEYNSGIPGVLKNGIDWMSRTYPDAPIGGKLAAVVGATPGRSGTQFAQEHLRRVLDRAGATVLSEPQVLVAHAGDQIVDGVIVSDELKTQLRSVFESLVDAAAQCKETGSAAVAKGA